MFTHATPTVARAYSFNTVPSRLSASTAPTLPEERLPFTVRLVRNEADLKKAVQIRHAAYARHLPIFAETLKTAETDDAEDGVVVLLAESKLDGSPLGTMRIQTNQFKPLSLEQSIELPDMAQVTLAGRGHPPGRHQREGRATRHHRSVQGLFPILSAD